MKKVSVAKLKFASHKPHKAITKIVREERGLEMNRIRIVTPITPAAVRQQMLKVFAGLPEDDRSRLIQTRLTPLDRFLSDDEARALERFATDEENLDSMKIGAFAGDRVQSSVAQRDGISDYRLAALAEHQRVKRCLSGDQISALRLWCQQMTRAPQAPSNVEAARRLRLNAPPCASLAFNLRLKRQEEALTAEWFNCLAALGQTLIGLYADRRH